MLLLFTLIVFSSTLMNLVVSTQQSPNIIFMFVDDLGFNDVGWNNNTRTKTPFLDKLALDESLLLTHNYVQKLCTPSRAAFLTGRYPMRYGMQHYVLKPQDSFSLTKQESLISTEFKSQGYATHIVGKWHLGFCSEDYTPLSRSFDTFFGYYLGKQDYFNHTVELVYDNASYTGYDVRENNDIVPVEDHVGIYGPHLQRDHLLSILSEYVNNKDDDTRKPFFIYTAWQESHDPAESLTTYYDEYFDEESDLGYRATYMRHQAQISSLDKTMEEVVTYLKENDLWDNLLLVVSSDNGAEYLYGDNAPLRGYKNTTWEGGVRVPGFVTGGLLPEKQRGQSLDNTIVHVTDWYPTLLSAANLQVTYAMDDPNIPNSLHEIDGIDMWSVISGESTEGNLYSRELLLDLDPYLCSIGVCGSIRFGKWKYILSDTSIETQSSEPETCFWGRDYEVSTNDILSCGSSPSTYLDYNKSDSGNDTSYAKCMTSGCAIKNVGCLYDLVNDPCEYYDVASQYPELTQYLLSRLHSYNVSQIEPLQTLVDTVSGDLLDPENYGGYWTPFYTKDEVEFEALLYEDYVSKTEKYQKWLAENGDNKKINIDSLLNKNSQNITNNTNGLILLSVGIFFSLCLIGYCLKKINNKCQSFCKKTNKNTNFNLNINESNEIYSRVSNDEVVDVTTKQFCERSPLIQK